MISIRPGRVNLKAGPKIADGKCVGIPGHEPILWNWYRVPGIPDITRSRRHRLRRKHPIGNFGLDRLEKPNRLDSRKLHSREKLAAVRKDTDVILVCGFPQNIFLTKREISISIILVNFRFFRLSV
jgi:hypothetical protein